MSWENELEAAREERSARIAAEQAAHEAKAASQRSLEARLRVIAAEVERILVAFDAVSWREAKWYRPSFAGLLKIGRQIRGESYVSLTIPEVLVDPPNTDRSSSVYANVELCRFGTDGRRAYVWCGSPSGWLPEVTRSGVVDFCGDPRGLKPEFILRAAARWAVEKNVSLSL